MLKKFTVSGVSDKKVLDYINHKIGGLDKLVPRHAQKSLHGEVRLSHHKAGASKFICKVVFYLPHQVLTANESADNYEGAIDQAEDKLKVQLHKYKELHSRSKQQRHLWGRFLKVS
jgi:ribosomal subunit interface protein